MKIFDTKHILKTLPHRYPFLLVDSVTNFVANQSCTGTKYVSMNEEFFTGHFPGRPIMPGVLQVEALAQTAIFLAMHSQGYTHEDHDIALASIDSCKFHKPVHPGSQLNLHVDIKKKVGHIYAFSGIVKVDGEVVSECEFKGAFWPSKEHTLAIIKPDAVRNRHVGEILQLLELNGLEVATHKVGGIHVPLKKWIHMTKEQAAEFYAIHSERPFFGDLCKFISSGESLVIVLKGKNAVEHYRHLMGATNPKDAAEGTIRNMYAVSIDENSVHGSDSKENAKKEINFFFPSFVVE